MNEDERLVLECLRDLTAPEECCMPFRPIEDATGLDRRRVRRACRSLARRGLAEYHRGLWSEDGEPAGAGYCVSKKGRRECST